MNVKDRCDAIFLKVCQLYRLPEGAWAGLNIEAQNNDFVKLLGPVDNLSAAEERLLKVMAIFVDDLTRTRMAGQRRNMAPPLPFRQWRDLQWRVFGLTTGGDRFYEYLGEAINGEQQLELRVFVTCLELGFQGDLQHLDGKLKEWKIEHSGRVTPVSSLIKFIRQQIKPLPGCLCEDAYSVDTTPLSKYTEAKNWKPKSSLPWITVVLLLAFCGVIGMFVFRFQNQTQGLLQTFRDIEMRAVH